MRLSRRDFEAEIKIGKILYFPCEDLNTPNPHYFICICIHPLGTVNLSCCTSQFETVRKLIERGKFPNQTLVYIPDDDTENPFKKDTYVNCNEYFPYLIQELWDIYQEGNLQLFSELPLHSFEQIIIGFQASPIIEEDLKENLPDINLL